MRQGPAALQRFAGDPECASVVARLRGVAPPPPPKRTPPATRRPRILLGATGSVATVKVPKLAVQLKAFADVRVVATERGRFFLGKARTYDSEAYGAFGQAQIEILSDDDEWARWNQVGDPVLHVDLREWADLLLIAPLGANTLAKLANGLCDDLLSCPGRAWDLDKPVIGWLHMAVFIAGATTTGLSRSHARAVQLNRSSQSPLASVEINQCVGCTR